MSKTRKKNIHDMAFLSSPNMDIIEHPFVDDGTTKDIKKRPRTPTSLSEWVTRQKQVDYYLAICKTGHRREFSKKGHLKHNGGWIHTHHLESNIDLFDRTYSIPPMYVFCGADADTDDLNQILNLYPEYPFFVCCIDNPVYIHRGVANNIICSHNTGQVLVNIIDEWKNRFGFQPHVTTTLTAIQSYMNNTISYTKLIETLKPMVQKVILAVYRCFLRLMRDRTMFISRNKNLTSQFDCLHNCIAATGFPKSSCTKIDTIMSFVAFLHNVMSLFQCDLPSIPDPHIYRFLNGWGDCDGYSTQWTPFVNVIPRGIRYCANFVANCFEMGSCQRSSWRLRVDSIDLSDLVRDYYRFIYDENATKKNNELEKELGNTKTSRSLVIYMINKTTQKVMVPSSIMVNCSNYRTSKVYQIPFMKLLGYESHQPGRTGIVGNQSHKLGVFSDVLYELVEPKLINNSIQNKYNQSADMLEASYGEDSRQDSFYFDFIFAFDNNPDENDVTMAIVTGEQLEVVVEMVNIATNIDYVAQERLFSMIAHSIPTYEDFPQYLKPSESMLQELYQVKPYPPPQYDLAPLKSRDYNFIFSHGSINSSSYDPHTVLSTLCTCYHKAFNLSSFLIAKMRTGVSTCPFCYNHLSITSLFFVDKKVLNFLNYNQYELSDSDSSILSPSIIKGIVDLCDSGDSSCGSSSSHTESECTSISDGYATPMDQDDDEDESFAKDIKSFLDSLPIAIEGETEEYYSSSSSSSSSVQFYSPQSTTANSPEEDWIDSLFA